jgi:hypothetical protein
VPFYHAYLVIFAGFAHLEHPLARRVQLPTDTGPLVLPKFTTRESSPSNLRFFNTRAKRWTELGLADVIIILVTRNCDRDSKFDSDRASLFLRCCDE